MGTAFIFQAGEVRTGFAAH